jgi:TPR repeat protein
MSLRTHIFLLFLASAFSLHANPPETAPVLETDEDDIEAVAAAKPTVDPSLKPYWDALKLFRSQQTPDLSRGRELLIQAADAENPHAENYLGICLQNALHGFAIDRRKAVTWFMLSAQRGNAFAKVNLGLCYFSGTGVRKDLTKARECLEAAVAENADFSTPRPPEDFFADAFAPDSKSIDADTTLSGNLPIEMADRYRARAHAALGDIFKKEKQPAKSQEHYVKASHAGEGGRAGIRDAAMKAAMNYAFGQGVPRDLTKANELLEQGKKLSRQEMASYAHGLVEKKLLDDFAQADVAEDIADKTDELYQQIQLSIGGSFADPKSKTYNPQEAARWFEIAAESGQAWAMLSLAELYQGKSLGAPDPAKAFTWFKEAAERGKHILGWANLAICYQHGFGTEKDAAKAAEIFKKHRETSIVCYLGTIDQCPATTLTFQQELALNKTWATKNKDAHACFIYGMRHLYGWGVKVDLDDAALWLRRAAKTNSGPAWRELGNMYIVYGAWMDSGLAKLDQRKKAFECFDKAAAAGDAEGMANLADLYAPPTGGVRYSFPQVDEKRAEALYLQALQLDPENGRAHNNLAVIYGNRFNKAFRNMRFLEGSEYREKMIAHYQAAHKAKIPTAAWNLGNLYYGAVMGEKDYQTAYAYFETAAGDGQVEARRRLGEMHEKGEGVPVTYREAAYHYRLAALAGDIDSLARLCGFYLQGKGVSQDLDRASMWLKMLAQRGRAGALVTLGDIMINRGEHAEALTFFSRMLTYQSPYLEGCAYDRLSRLYTTGKGVKANPAKAKRYHEKAVGLGNPEAICTDADQLIAEKKYDAAVALLKKSADTGSSNAEYKLSTLYFNGLGVPTDIATAIKHCRKAAEDGHLHAQFSLSVLTLQDVPGAPALEEAIRYAEAAETGGVSKAGTVRKKLEEKRGRVMPSASEDARAL